MGCFPLALITKDKNNYKPILNHYMFKKYIPNDAINISTVDGVEIYPYYKEFYEYYEIGGLFNNTLLIKNSNEKTNIARIYNIDFERMSKISSNELNKFWNTTVHEKNDLFSMYKNKEDYINLSSLFYTEAVITPDGKYHYDISKNEDIKEYRAWILNYYDNFLKHNMDNYLIMVTCVTC
jgi:hypothetical protein